MLQSLVLPPTFVAGKWVSPLTDQIGCDFGGDDS